jgi:hypothetical protein
MSRAIENIRLLPERLVSIDEYSKKILTALGSTCTLLTQETSVEPDVGGDGQRGALMRKPFVFLDPTYQPILKALSKKFPDQPDLNKVYNFNLSSSQG